MKTKQHILLVLAAVALVVVAAVVVAMVLLGWANGLAVAALVVVLLAVGYQNLVRPWHTTWGTHHQEHEAPLPGDDLVELSTPTTRAITIDAPPAEVWPWLVQIGFGRAGWYSYDWLDNDGVPSADRIVPELQHLVPGDRIPMTPELGFVVKTVVPERFLVSLSDDGSTSWCLSLTAVEGDPGSSRLVSRFRLQPIMSFPALIWAMIADPGAFIMERKMLKGIRHRAEAVGAAHPADTAA